MIVFRLKTAVKVVGIDEPTVITPTIDEPVKWSDVPLIGSRDKKYHGFNYNYSDGDLKLDFTCENAHELISAQYYTYGIDAIVSFLVVDVARNGDEFIEYDGRIDFETIEILPGRVSVSVVNNDDHTKMASRWESPIALDSKLTLDNVPIDPTSVLQIALTGQTLHESGQFQRQQLYTEHKTFQASEGYDMGGAFYVLPKMYFTDQSTLTAPTSTTPIPALETLADVSLLYGDVWPLNLPEPPPILSCQAAGNYHLEIDWLFRVNCVLSKNSLFAGNAQFAIMQMVPMLVIKRPGLDAETVALAPPQNANGFVSPVEFLFTVNYVSDLDIPLGTQVYIFCKVIAFSVRSIKQIEFYVECVNLRILIDRKTRASASQTTAYLLPDALRHVVGAITSTIDQSTKTGRVYGGLIDYAHTGQALDGYTTEYAITTGALLRGLTKVPTFTAKDLFETLWTQHQAGILYEKDLDTGIQSIRVEEGEWFYRGGEIAVIDTVFEYKEDPDLDLIFNQIIVGYQTYPESGVGVAEEFNTVHTYQTPIVNRDEKLEILCPLIAAGTAIEAARRLGIKKVVDGKEVSSTSDAGSYDDNGFILHVSPFSHADTVQFIIADPTVMKPYTQHYIQFSNAVINTGSSGISLKYGDKLIFSSTGTANDGIVYTVLGIRLSVDNFSLAPTYEVDASAPMVATGAVSVNWRLGINSVKLRTNERLDVQGVVDPESTPNLELSPARMLYRHAPFINSGLAYKQAIDVLRCTAFKQNGSVKTQAKPSVAALPGDPDKQLIRETGDIALGAFQRFKQLFHPDLIKAKVLITRETRRAIFAAMKNRGPEDVNCGYLTIKNPDGNYVKAYLFDISYKDSSEVADIVCRKRRADPDPNAPNCEDYYDWVYNQFVNNPNANPNIYRFCRFNDFAPA